MTQTQLKKDTAFPLNDQSLLFDCPTSYHGYPYISTLLYLITRNICIQVDVFKLKNLWVSFSDTFFVEAQQAVVWQSIGRKEIFYLTMHSTHFMYRYMASETMYRCQNPILSCLAHADNQYVDLWV